MNNQPHIILSSLDLARIERLLDSLPEHQFPGKRALEQELDRAEVRDPEEMPPHVVTMNSEVRFRLQPSGEEFCLTLVYPKDVNGHADRISILLRSAAPCSASPSVTRSPGQVPVASHCRSPSSKLSINRSAIWSSIASPSA